eukprot:scaffold13168_cov66-Cyclotella_meneghiniana.AAC.1
MYHPGVADGLFEGGFVCPATGLDVGAELIEVGLSVGADVVNFDGLVEGDEIGCIDGAVDGLKVGEVFGNFDGAVDGLFEGGFVCPAIGLVVGTVLKEVGLAVGADVVNFDGLAEGDEIGCIDGA